MAYGDEELDAALQDLAACGAAEELDVGGTRFTALWNESDTELQDQTGRTVVPRGVTAIVQTAAVPATLAVETELLRLSTNVTYRVRRILRQAPDGALTELSLVKVT